MVRPDNPNIVYPQPNDAPAQRQIPAAPVPVAESLNPVPVAESLNPVPVAEPLTPTTKPDKPRKFKDVGYPACCGASFLLIEPPASKKKTPEEEARSYYEAKNFVATRDNYLGYVKVYEDDLKGWEAGGKKVRTPRGNHPNTTRQYIKDYQNAADSYEFEYMFKKGLLNGKAGQYDRDMATYKSPGIALSMDQFHGAHQTPAGLWVRNDYEIRENYSGKPFTVPEPFETPDVKRDKAVALTLTSHTHDNGYKVHLIQGMSRDDLANDIASFIARNKKFAVGDVVTFILNKGQGTQQKLNKLAAAGYRHVLTTSNANHNGSSILYLFERTLTDVDKPNGQ